MGKSRSQISQQLVSLLNGSGALGSNASAFEAAVGVENFLASGKTLPIAAVQTLEAIADTDVPGRFDRARFRVGIAGLKTSETGVSSNLASGGTASGQHSAESTIKSVLAALNVTPAWAFVDSTHGFQGVIESEGPERLVVAAGATYVISEFIVTAFNATRFDT